MKPTQTAWQELLKQAVVGLERGSAEVDERQLLDQMASLSLRKRAGKILKRSQLESQASPTENLPAATGKVFARLLNQQQQELLLVYLQGLAQSQRRLPEDHLVEALSSAREHRIREALLPVLGERGRWLAEHNESWHWASKVDEASWQTGNKAERLQVLKQLRESQPAQARALIQSTWQEDSASDRSNFVAVLASGLSLDDEPFLESTLAERSKQVRSESVRLLASMPASRLCQRMAVRAKALLALETKALRRSTLKLELLTALDDRLICDGIQEKPQHKAVGKKAWWTEQILQATPLDCWQEHLELKPEQIIAAANNNTEWRQLLLGSLETSVLRFAEPTWAKALINAYLDNKLKVSFEHPGELLALAYDRGEGDALLLKSVKQSPSLYKDALLKDLLLAHKAWSAVLTKEVIKSFAKDVSSINNYVSTIQIYQRFALHMQPETAKQALDSMPPSLKRANWLDNVVDAVRATIDLRAAIAKELASY